MIWKTEKDLEDYLKVLVKELTFPMMIGLVGQLGAGKTTFVRYLNQLLGGKDRVSSPSYVLENIYSLPNNKEISHWDLYRLEQCPDELCGIPQNQQIRVIEWINKFPELEIKADILLQINLLEQEDSLIRQVVVTKN